MARDTLEVRTPFSDTWTDPREAIRSAQDAVYEMFQIMLESGAVPTEKIYKRQPAVPHVERPKFIIEAGSIRDENGKTIYDGMLLKLIVVLEVPDSDRS